MEVLWASAFHYSIYFGGCWMLARRDLRNIASFVLMNLPFVSNELHFQHFHIWKSSWVRTKWALEELGRADDGETANVYFHPKMPVLRGGGSCSSTAAVLCSSNYRLWHFQTWCCVRPGKLCVAGVECTEPWLREVEVRFLSPPPHQFPVPLRATHRTADQKSTWFISPVSGSEKQEWSKPGRLWGDTASARAVPVCLVWYKSLCSSGLTGQLV